MNSSSFTSITVVFLWDKIQDNTLLLVCIQNRFHYFFLAVYFFTYTDPHFKFTFCLKVLHRTRSRLPKLQTPSACSCFPKGPASMSALLPTQATRSRWTYYSLLFPFPLLIPPPGAQFPHHNTGHSLCPQAVPSSSSKEESPKSWHHGDSSPKGEQSAGRLCMPARILALLLPLPIHHHIIIYHCKLC